MWIQNKYHNAINQMLRKKFFWFILQWFNFHINPLWNEKRQHLKQEDAITMVNYHISSGLHYSLVWFNSQAVSEEVNGDWDCFTNNFFKEPRLFYPDLDMIHLTITKSWLKVWWLYMVLKLYCDSLFDVK